MRSKKIFSVIAVILCFTFLFTACQPQTVVQTVEVEKVVKETVVVEKEVEVVAPIVEVEEVPPFKVAVLLPGPIADGGWNMLAYQGVVALQADPTYEVVYTESLPVKDFPTTVRGYADDGYQLIIGHGSQFTTVLIEIAPEYPDTKFFVTSTAPPDETIPQNLAFINMIYHYGGYLAGALASLISETHVVGIVGGADNPIQRSIANAFVQGAEETVEGTTGLMVITGDYNDAARGREAAMTMFGNGVDVLMHWANVTGLGAIMAGVEQGKTVIGVYSDQAGMAPNSFATSLLLDLKNIILLVAQSAKDGTFEGGGNRPTTFKELYRFAYGSQEFNANKVSQENADKMHEIMEKILDGEIEVKLVLD